MSFFFPSVFYEDDDDYSEPLLTMAQFLNGMNSQRMQQQQQQRKVPTAQPRYYCVQKQMPMYDDEEEEEGATSDGEVIETHQKREEQKKEQKEKEEQLKKEQKEEEEQLMKEIAEAEARAEKDSVLVPSADVVENDTHFIITMNMPGLKKDQIIVSLDENILTVKAERAQPCADAKIVLRREIPHGKIERQFEVPKGVKPDAIYAKVEDGVLTITIKKPVVEAPRSISIA